MDGPVKKQRILGGNRAVLPIFAMQGLDSMAFLANELSLFTYLYGFVNFGMTKSANTLANFMGTAFLLALLGGFVADTYFSKFMACTLFASFELLGYGLLTTQAYFDKLRPTTCNGGQLTDPTQCDSPKSWQSAVLYVGLFLVALGTGGVKAALPALGADQFDPKEAPKLSTFFNWFFFSLTAGSVVGVTFIVGIGENKGWDLAFGLSALGVALAVFFLVLGKPLYRITAPHGSPIVVRIAQVFVAAMRNRHLEAPKPEDTLYEKEGINGEILKRTNQFRFLDKAAVATNKHQASYPSPPDPWRLCTKTQVEETKILIRMLPIIFSTIFLNTCLVQLQTFTIQQGNTMNRKLGGFQVPASSVPVIPLLFTSLMIPLYDRVFVPFARSLTGDPSGICHLHRIGVGLVLSAVSMAVAAVVESKRRNVAIENNMVDSLLPLPYSLFWLGFQYCIFGVAEFLAAVGLLEFFYSESLAGMKALATGISMCSSSFGYYLSTVVVEVVNRVSDGWLASNNLNRVKLDNFYWLLAGLSVVNFGVHMVFTSWYRYKEVEEEGDELEMVVA